MRESRLTLPCGSASRAASIPCLSGVARTDLLFVFLAAAFSRPLHLRTHPSAKEHAVSYSTPSAQPDKQTSEPLSRTRRTPRHAPSIISNSFVSPPSLLPRRSTTEHRGQAFRGRTDSSFCFNPVSLWGEGSVGWVKPRRPPPAGPCLLGGSRCLLALPPTKRPTVEVRFACSAARIRRFGPRRAGHVSSWMSSTVRARGGEMNEAR